MDVAPFDAQTYRSFKGHSTKDDVKIVAFWTPKGGVGTTTVVHDIAWKFSRTPRRVALVDCSPQCNLTQITLMNTVDERHDGDYDEFFKGPGFVPDAPKTLYDPLAYQIDTYECAPRIPQLTVLSKDNIFLLPGSTRLNTLESRYTMVADERLAICVKQPMMLNQVGTFHRLLLCMAHYYNLDVILLDLDRSTGYTLTMIFMMSATHWVMPVGLDYFSQQAVRSVEDHVTAWLKWATKYRHVQDFQQNGAVTMPIPNTLPHFVGAIITRYQKGDALRVPIIVEELKKLGNALLEPANSEELRKLSATILTTQNNPILEEELRTVFRCLSTPMNDPIVLGITPDYGKLVDALGVSILARTGCDTPIQRAYYEIFSKMVGRL